MHEIIEKLEAIEGRLRQLEIIKVQQATVPGGISQPRKSKAVTLAELVKGFKFQNGQEKVAAIIGYWEKVEGKSEVPVKDIEQAWRNGKLDGSYHPNYLQRAVADGLIRELDKGVYDLSQSGEGFFEKLLANCSKRKEGVN